MLFAVLYLFGAISALSFNGWSGRSSLQFYALGGLVIVAVMISVGFGLAVVNAAKERRYTSAGVHLARSFLGVPLFIVLFNSGLLPL